MILGAAMAVTCRPLPRPVCRATSSIAKTSSELLRFQLDQLHAEADSARAEANSARLRLMRLSEAAENLKRQAAICVHSGKEEDARDLLFQKKKVMHAMERSKSRIELLDQLFAKLNEAISVKESQLIGNTALDLEVDLEDSSNPVRIIPLKQEVLDDKDKAKGSDSDSPNLTDSQDLLFCADGKASPPTDGELGSHSMGIRNEDSIIRGLNDISSYEDFLEHVDIQLNRIEAELITVLNVSALVLNDEEKPKNSKLQQTIELLESVRAVRRRIERIIQRKVDIR